MGTAFDNYVQGRNSSDPLVSSDDQPETWAQRNWSLTNEQQACLRVFEYVKPRLEKTDKHVTFEKDSVYVVSFTYILGNWKALVSTTLPDGMYYEVTHNFEKRETYLDAYKKFDNVCLTD